MADSASTPQGTLVVNNDGSAVAFWENIGGLATGSAMKLGRYPDRTVTFAGTWGWATAIIQGSNDGTYWFTVDDADGNAVSFTADGAALIRDNPSQLRVKTTGGTSTNLDVHMNMKANR